MVLPCSHIWTHTGRCPYSCNAQLGQLFSRVATFEILRIGTDTDLQKAECFLIRLLSLELRGEQRNIFKGLINNKWHTDNVRIRMCEWSTTAAHESNSRDGPIT